MDNTEQQERFKVIIIGDSAVGKSSIAAQQCNKEFDSNLNPTIGSAHLITTIDLSPDQKVTLVIWDTAGQEEFAPLVPMYARKANCALIVGSATSEDSINNMKKWEDTLYQSGERPPVIAVINKMDLVEDQTKKVDDVKLKLGNEFPSIFFVSAKTSYNISELFVEVARKCTVSDEEPEESPITMKKKEKSGCC